MFICATFQENKLYGAFEGAGVFLHDFFNAETLDHSEVEQVVLECELMIDQDDFVVGVDFKCLCSRTYHIMTIVELQHGNKAA